MDEFEMLKNMHLSTYLLLYIIVLAFIFLLCVFSKLFSTEKPIRNWKDIVKRSLIGALLFLGIWVLFFVAMAIIVGSLTEMYFEIVFIRPFVILLPLFLVFVFIGLCINLSYKNFLESMINHITKPKKEN